MKEINAFVKTTNTAAVQLAAGHIILKPGELGVKMSVETLSSSAITATS